MLRHYQIMTIIRFCRLLFLSFCWSGVIRSDGHLNRWGDITTNAKETRWEIQSAKECGSQNERQSGKKRQACRAALDVWLQMSGRAV